jgi:archaellum component FlaC
MTEKITLAGMDKLAEKIKSIERSILDVRNKLSELSTRVDSCLDKIENHFVSVENDIEEIGGMKRKVDEITEKLNNFDSSFEMICGNEDEPLVTVKIGK